MEVAEILLLVVFGSFAGLMAGFFGIGGGTIIVPIMVTFGYDIKSAVGISILQMLFGAIFGSYINYKKGKLVLKDGFAVGLGGLCGASLSGIIVSNVPNFVLEAGLLSALLVAISKFFTSNVTAQPKNPPNFVLFVIGFCIGAFAISMGIGGGLFLTPILVGFLGVDIKKAVSMGLFFVIFSSFSGFLSLAKFGYVDYIAGSLLGIGSLIGVYFGINLSHKVQKTTQKWLLLLLYITMFCLILKKILGF